MWTGLSPRTNGKDSTAEHSKTGATEMKTVEALLVCKLSESPFRILSVGLSCYFLFYSKADWIYYAWRLFVHQSS